MMLPPIGPAHQALLWAPPGRTRRRMTENELAPDRRSCLSDGVTSFATARSPKKRSFVFDRDGMQQQIAYDGHTLMDGC
ncbi:hypothetical protein LSAT2_018467 [Lamellibrachia satsuma]|nr:hypothetical protein LSAT2_018467 [Lamellibrachia satsuma]